MLERAVDEPSLLRHRGIGQGGATAASRPRVVALEGRSFWRASASLPLLTHTPHMRMHAFECAVEARELSSGSPFSFVVLALRVLHSGRTDTVATRGVRPVVQPSLCDSVSHFLLSLMSHV
mmetsp:Transcript_37504/g.124268  ORF Transcript_37504/g.124268 Transcript_37504/m.124268 type:complete len:121 (-) Transcript_37504:72-434(-)